MYWTAKIAFNQIVFPNHENGNLMKRILCLVVIVFASPAFASNPKSPEIWDCAVTTPGPSPVTTIERFTVSGKIVQETDKWLAGSGFLPPQYSVEQDDSIGLIAIDNLTGKDDSGVYVVSSATLMIDKTRKTMREFSMESTDNIASVSTGDCLGR